MFCWLCRSFSFFNWAQVIIVLQTQLRVLDWMLQLVVSGVGGVKEFSWMPMCFNPFAPSNSLMSLEKCFLKHEQEKKRVYQQRVCECHFCPSCSFCNWWYGQGSYQFLQAFSVSPC